MNWLIAYAATSTAAALLAIALRRYLAPEWRETLAWAALLAPIAVATQLNSDALRRHQVIVVAAAVTPIVRADPITEPSLPERSPAPLFLVWGVGALVLVGRDVVRRRRLLRLLARRPSADPSMETLARALASRLGVSRPVRVTVSANSKVPFALGASEICLPGDLPPSEREAVLAHELAHLARLDPWRGQLAGLLASVFWWQPCNRAMRRLVTESAELLADREACRVVPSLALARALLQFADRGRHRPALATALTASPLAERVQRLLERRHPRSVSGPLRTTITLAAVATVMAAVPPVPVPVLAATQVAALQAATPRPAARQEARPRAGRALPAAPDEPVPAASDDDVVATLATLLADSSIHVRQAARRSLRDLGDSASKAALSRDTWREHDRAAGKDPDQ